MFEPRVHLVPDNGGAGHFNVLRGHLPRAWGGAAVSGVKVVGDFVENYARGLPSELGLLTLYDPGTGIPLAIMDATLITACRTGAMTAVGARYLARPDARVLGHVGARGTAFWNVVLLDEMFDLDEIRVTSRRPESREAFARQLRRRHRHPGAGDRYGGRGVRRRRHPGRGDPADRARAAAAHRRRSGPARSLFPTARSARSSLTCST